MACFLLGSGCQRDAFFCDTPEDCTSEDGGGACESTGYCSFPDPECDTGRRYGDLAPSGLAGTCVPQTEDTEGSGPPTSTSGSTTDPTDPTLAETTSANTSEPSTSTTAPATSTESTEGGESSSTGDTPSCCDASCSTCGESCASEVLDSTDAGEALAVAVIGTTLVWTTGFTREVFSFDLTSGESTLLATVPHILTNITADDEYIYYLSYSNAFVGRISLASGAQSIVTDANNVDAAFEFEAGYGQIVLDESDVYFALANTPNKADGGAFRAPKAPNLDEPPERIGTLQRPVGIGVDEDFIYISDETQGRLLRFDKVAPGPAGSEMLEILSPGHIHVADTDVYATGSGGELFRVPKDGSVPALLVTTGGAIQGITADGAHVYVTDLQAGSVTRASLFDTEPPAQIAASPGAWGIATDCNHVYWCENGSLSVLRQPK